MLTFSDKQKWKPTFVESRNSFVLWIKSITDLHAEVEAHYKSRAQKGDLPKSPVIVVVAPELTQLKYFIVCFGDARYQLPTFLKALDVCFKIFKAYSLPFPRESAGPWNLLNHVVYGFPIEGDHRAKIASIASIIHSKHVSLPSA